MYTIGIDPGVSNLGLSILDEKNEIVLVERLVPKNLGLINPCVDRIEEIISPFLKETVSVGVEKYVVYGRGVPSTSMVDTTMLVGALSYMFHRNGLEAQLFKAIDWKKSICKHLFKEEGFKNPSDSFDKKYSLAVAEHICGKKLKTDHEADAVGIAYNARLRKENAVSTR